MYIMATSGTSRGTKNGEDGQISSFLTTVHKGKTFWGTSKRTAPPPNCDNSATVHTIYIGGYLRRRHPRSGRGRSFPAQGLQARKEGCRRPGSSWRLRQHPDSWVRQECGTRSAQGRPPAQPRRGTPATPPLGHPPANRNDINCRLRLKCDGTSAETRFRLSPKRTSPFKSARASVHSNTGSRDVHIRGSNAGYTMFRVSVKGIGYPLHSPVSPSLPTPVRHRVPSHFNWTLQPHQV